jgi:hypothetical protein
MPENLEKIVSEEVKETIEGEKIPATMAISSELKEYDSYKVVLSFEQYNQNCCEISQIQKPEAKKLTSELKRMTGTLRKHFLHQDASGIACKPVEDGGNYESLFTGLQRDVELLEVDYTSTGRIFGYLTKNIFNVVAIKIKHIKGGKYT